MTGECGVPAARHRDIQNRIQEVWLKGDYCCEGRERRFNWFEVIKLLSLITFIIVRVFFSYKVMHMFLTFQKIFPNFTNV